MAPLGTLTDFSLSYHPALNWWCLRAPSWVLFSPPLYASWWLIHKSFPKDSVTILNPLSPPVSWAPNPGTQLPLHRSTWWPSGASYTMHVWQCARHCSQCLKFIHYICNNPFTDEETDAQQTRNLRVHHPVPSQLWIPWYILSCWGSQMSNHPDPHARSLVFPDSIHSLVPPSPIILPSQWLLNLSTYPHFHGEHFSPSLPPSTAWVCTKSP